MSDQSKAETLLKQAAGAYRAAVREELAFMRSRLPRQEYVRHLLRIVSTRRGNVSSSEAPSVMNFIELTERDEAIRAIDRLTWDDRDAIADATQ